jgi:hypothetical protein
MDCGQMQGGFPVDIKSVADENELDIDTTYEEPEKRQQRIDALETAIDQSEECTCNGNCGKDCKCANSH